MSYILLAHVAETIHMVDYTANHVPENLSRICENQTTTMWTSKNVNHAKCIMF